MKFGNGCSRNGCGGGAGDGSNKMSSQLSDMLPVPATEGVEWAPSTTGTGLLSDIGSGDSDSDVDGEDNVPVRTSSQLSEGDECVKLCCCCCCCCCSGSSSSDPSHNEMRSTIE